MIYQSIYQTIHGGSVTHSIHIGGGKKGIVSIDFIEDVDTTEIDIY